MGLFFQITPTPPSFLDLTADEAIALVGVEGFDLTWTKQVCSKQFVQVPVFDHGKGDIPPDLPFRSNRNLSCYVSMTSTTIHWSSIPISIQNGHHSNHSNRSLSPNRCLDQMLVLHSLKKESCTRAGGIIHSFIRSFVRSFIRSLVHSFIHSSIHS